MEDKLSEMSLEGVLKIFLLTFVIIMKMYN